MYFKNEKGSSYVITVIVMAVILGSVALVIDIGYSFIVKSRLMNAADAAVLAGAVELPTNPNKAIDIATLYLNENGVSENEVNIVIKENNTILEIDINRNVNHLFAGVIGINNSNINGKSGAKIGPASAIYNGIRPFVVEEQNFDYGQEVILKEGAGDGYRGNYGAVALGGSGATVFLENVKYGYNGKLKVGDMIDTETGNMSGRTKQGINFILSLDNSSFNNFDRDSLRLWTIPLVDSLEVNGRKQVKIVGFAQFFLDGMRYSGGKTEIIGRFIEFVTNADIDDDQIDYGLKGVKLIY